MVNKSHRIKNGRAGSVILGGQPQTQHEFSIKNLPVLNIPSEKRLKYMKDLDLDKDVPPPIKSNFNTITHAVEKGEEPTIIKGSPTPFKSRYKHEMFFDKGIPSTVRKPKYAGGFDYKKSLEEIQQLESGIDMVGKSSYSQSFAPDMKLFNSKSNTAKKHNHDAPYHHLHTLDPYMKNTNADTLDLKN